MKRPIFLMVAAISGLIAVACQEQRASTTLPILGSNRQVNYTYRFVPRSSNLTGNGKAAIVVVAELPFLKGALEDILRAEGLPTGTRTNRNTFSNFHGFDVSGGSVTGSFQVRNQEYTTAFDTLLSDVTVAVDLRLTPIVDRRGQLDFRVSGNHRKISGSGIAAVLDDLSSGKLINVQREIDSAFHAAQRLVPANIESGFSGQDVAPHSGPIRKLTLVKARFLSTVSSPVALEFVFNPG